MKLKKIVLFTSVLIFIELILGVFIVKTAQIPKLDMVKVNELMHSCVEKWSQLEEGQAVQMPHSQYSYAVFNQEGKLLYVQNGDRTLTVQKAIKGRDTIVDLCIRDKRIGKLVIVNDYVYQVDQLGHKLFLLVVGSTGLCVLFFVIYSLYLEKTVFRPFRMLKNFAVRVANGNLDIPLSMDRNNVFGSFTESFDLMRHELKRAREQERLANQSKKELVAKLSHDIKTPIASIKAVAEVMTISAKSEKEKQQLNVIGAKADQVDVLISNLFHATLEELQELEVNPTEQSSQKLRGLLEQADYLEKAQIGEIPECLVLFDPLRLQQVFDNIFGNSYKYANTSMCVTANLSSTALIIRCRDYGPGVPTEELTLIFKKFYRSKNVSEKSGAGLGLYISHYLMEQMSGALFCENLEDGFCVCVSLKI